MQPGHVRMEYGDDQVHFDPIRAVQSINLSNNYRTARSNDNFLSTVILNTYFFNNAVLHHDDIKQSPPKKFHYNTDDQFSESSSSADDDPSSSSFSSTSSTCSSSADDDDEEDDDGRSTTSETKTEDLDSHSHGLMDLLAPSATATTSNGHRPRHSHSSRHQVSSSMNNVESISNQLHLLQPVCTYTFAPCFGTAFCTAYPCTLCLGAVYSNHSVQRAAN